MNDHRVIDVASVDKSFGERKVLDKVTMHVCHGEIVSVLGVSGSGKTTLFNLITGLETADRGEIRCASDIGYMLQKDLLMPWKTIEENIALPLILKGVKRSSAINEIRQYFELFGLEGTGKAYPGTLSGGMRQRAALLRTWLISGEIMLLDEPFSSVDAITRHKLHKWLKKIKEKMDLTILLITHDVEEALTLSNRIYVMGGNPASMADEIVLNSDLKDRADPVTPANPVDRADPDDHRTDTEAVADRSSARQRIFVTLEKDLERST